jgi:hypothetical protein
VLEAVAAGALSTMAHAVEKPIEEGVIVMGEYWGQLAEIGGGTGMAFASSHHEATDAAEHPGGAPGRKNAVERSSE